MTCDIVCCVTWHFAGQYDLRGIYVFYITQPPSNICWSFIYLPFMANTCSSGIQLSMKSAGKILCMSDTFTLLSLPVRSDTSNCLMTISLTILKFGTYLVSHVNFLSKFVIIIKSPTLYWGTLLCLPHFCLEHSSWEFNTTIMYVWHNLLRLVMPSSKPKYLNLGCKKVPRCGEYGSHPKYRKWGNSWGCSFGNQLKAMVAYGNNWSNSKIPPKGNFHMQFFMNLWDDSNFTFDWGWQGDIYIILMPSCCINCSMSCNLNSVPLSECRILGNQIYGKFQKINVQLWLKSFCQVCGLS